VGESEPAGASALERLGATMGSRPWEFYAAMRAESPVLRQEGIGVLVAGRKEIDEVLRHPDRFSSGMDATDLKNERPLIPLQIDPPDHKKYRRILDPVFAPQRMKEREADLAALVNDLIDGFIGDPEIDLTKQFTIPFPSQVFLTLIGLPLDELPRFLEMKDGIIRPRDADHQAATARSIYDYFEGVLDERMADGAPRRDDLIQHFLDAEVDGERLTRDDIVDICFLFLIAGLDTVTASLECFFTFLARNPERRHELVADPSLIPGVVEELLRWETPVMVITRVATQDTEVGTCPVAKGDHVLTFLGSANTDEAEHDDAGVVRWDREENRHLAFGGGIHRCLGSHLARLELRIALREWHARIPDYRLPEGFDPPFSPGIRSVDSLPLELGVSA
jgi:cytochrome P450